MGLTEKYSHDGATKKKSEQSIDRSQRASNGCKDMCSFREERWGAQLSLDNCLAEIVE